MHPVDRWTLYGSKGSGSAAVEMALALCGIDPGHVRASTWETDSARDALAAVNPLGQIPTLVAPDGTVLTESAAILAELGLRHPDSGLLSAEPVRRARELRALVFVATNCYAAIGVLDYPERWLPQGGDDSLQALRAGARQRLHTCWTAFAQAFQPLGFFFGGERLGAVDLLAAVVSRWSGGRAHLAAAHPVHGAWLQRVDAHPVVAAVAARHWPAA